VGTVTDNDQEVITASDLTTADEFVPEICAGLDVSETVAKRASSLARKYDGLGMPTINRAPRTIAAGAVYYASLTENEKVTQDEVANAAALCVASLRDAYHEICEYEGLTEVKEEAESPDDESADGAVISPGWGLVPVSLIAKLSASLLVVFGVANLMSALAGPVTAVTPAFERAAETALKPERIMLAGLIAMVSGAIVVALSAILPRRRNT